MASIRKRLEELEKKLGGCLPLVVCVFKNGTKNEYKGFPDIDCLLNPDNPVVDIYGSEFAKLVKAVIFPKENRNIDDFEEDIPNIIPNEIVDFKEDDVEERFKYV